MRLFRIIFAACIALGAVSPAGAANPPIQAFPWTTGGNMAGGSNTTSYVDAVRDFNAPTNGLVDAAPALNAAAMAAEGGTLYISKGLFLINSTLLAGNVTIRGDGDSTVIFATNTWNFPTAYPKLLANRSSWVPSQGGSPPLPIAWNSYHWLNFKLVNAIPTNLTGWALSGPPGGLPSTGTSSPDVTIGYCHDSTISGVHFVSSAPGAGSQVITIQGACSNLTISGNLLENLTYNTNYGTVLICDVNLGTALAPGFVSGLRVEGNIVNHSAWDEAIMVAAGYSAAYPGPTIITDWHVRRNVINLLGGPNSKGMTLMGGSDYSSATASTMANGDCTGNYIYATNTWYSLLQLGGCGSFSNNVIADNVLQNYSTNLNANGVNGIHCDSGYANGTAIKLINNHIWNWSPTNMLTAFDRLGSGFTVRGGSLRGGFNNTNLNCACPISMVEVSNTFISGVSANVVQLSSGQTIGGVASDGLNNLFMGTGAGAANTSGHDNSFSGLNSGHANTTGYYDTAVGASALLSLTTGFNNTAEGQGAGENLTTGASDVAIGTQALFADWADNGNSALGYQALIALTNGGANTASGDQAGWALTNGAGNTLNGNRAGAGLVQGSYNSYVGDQSGPPNGAGRSESYALAFGYGADAGGTGNIAIGGPQNAGKVFSTSAIYTGSGAGLTNLTNFALAAAAGDTAGVRAPTLAAGASLIGAPSNQVIRLGALLPAQSAECTIMRDTNSLLLSLPSSTWIVKCWGDGGYFESATGTNGWVGPSNDFPQASRGNVLRDAAGLYHRWNNDFVNQTNIYHYTSPQGTNWTKIGVAFTTNATWNMQGLGNIGVMWDPLTSKFRALLDGLGLINGGVYWSVGEYDSSDGVNWTPYSGNPVLSIQGSAYWEATSCRPFYTNGAYYTFCQIMPYQAALPSEIGLYKSPDMVHWTPCNGGYPVITRQSWFEGAWNNTTIYTTTPGSSSQVADCPQPVDMGGWTLLVWSALMDQRAIGPSPGFGYVPLGLSSWLASLSGPPPGLEVAGPISLSRSAWGRGLDQVTNVQNGGLNMVSDLPWTIKGGLSVQSSGGGVPLYLFNSSGTQVGYADNSGNWNINGGVLFDSSGVYSGTAMNASGLLLGSGQNAVLGLLGTGLFAYHTGTDGSAALTVQQDTVGSAGPLQVWRGTNSLAYASMDQLGDLTLNSVIGASGTLTLNNGSGTAVSTLGNLQVGGTAFFTNNVAIKQTLTVGSTLWPSNGVAFAQQSSTPNAATIGGVSGSVTNHLLLNRNGLLIDFWSDGTTVYSKQLAP